MILVGAIVFDDRHRAGRRRARSREGALEREAGIEQARAACAADAACRAEREAACRAGDDVLDASGCQVGVARDHQRRRCGNVRSSKARSDGELVVRVAGTCTAIVPGRHDPVGHCTVASGCG